MPRAVGAGLQCPPAEPARTAPLPGARSLPRAQQGPGESFPAQKARGGGAPRGASTLTSRRGLSAPPGRAVLRGRRDAFRCSTAAIFGPLAALPGGDGARFQAPDPERRPCRSFVSAACSPLLRRAGGQPVLMPAGGWAGPPECGGTNPARGRRLPPHVRPCLAERSSRGMSIPRIVGVGGSQGAAKNCRLRLTILRLFLTHCARKMFLA